MTSFSKAGAAEILRANQKDESFLYYLKSQIADIVLNIAGMLNCNVFLYNNFTIS